MNTQVIRRYLFQSICLFFFFVIFSSNVFASSEEDAITTIILINRQAELVDISLDGEVLRRYSTIPDYFTSGRSHQKSLKKVLQKIKDYGSIDHTLPQSSKLCPLTLQSFMIQSNRPATTYQPSCASSMLGHASLDTHYSQYLVHRTLDSWPEAALKTFIPNNFNSHHEVKILLSRQHNVTCKRNHIYLQRTRYEESLGHRIV